MTDKYDLHSKFDIEQHKKHYVNYLEVIILKDGTVEYAIPSHQEKLIDLACKQNHITRKDLIDSCPPDYYGDFIKWLCIQTGAISVWNDFCVYHTFNMKQVAILDALKIAGLYQGRLLGDKEVK